MEKLLPYTIQIPLIALAVIPASDISISMCDSTLWVWLVLLSGFFGFYVLFLKVGLPIKILSVYVFINCFLSRAPYISFTSYIIFIACLYYYIFCLKIKSWETIYKSLLVVLILNLSLVLLQRFRLDTLMNFGLEKNMLWGTTGNPMQSKSFFIILVSFLTAYKKPKWIYRLKYILLSFLAAGAIIYYFQYGIGWKFTTIRLPAWLEAIRITGEHPFIGWGIGTFKAIFPALGKGTFTQEGIWFTLHNDWLEFIFETGIIGGALIFSYMARLIYRLLRIKEYFCFIGLMFVSFSMLVYFPFRQTDCLLLAVTFFAFCEYRIGEKKWHILR